MPATAFAPAMACGLDMISTGYQPSEGYAQCWMQMATSLR